MPVAFRAHIGSGHLDNIPTQLVEKTAAMHVGLPLLRMELAIIFNGRRILSRNGLKDLLTDKRLSIEESVFSRTKRNALLQARSPQTLTGHSPSRSRYVSRRSTEVRLSCGSRRIMLSASTTSSAGLSTRAIITHVHSGDVQHTASSTMCV